MLARFCLYGFLKNQKYYEPFLILAFLEKGLSFFDIGLLIAFREVAINLCELPSGAVADLWGRRRSMMFSFGMYLAAFAVFALSSQVWMLFGAMACFAVGESFRSGTHKAMILDWLSRQGRVDEKARIYGTTRSWSQIGSAVSVLIAALIVLWSSGYTYVFWASMPPYVLGLINFLGYPTYLDGARRRSSSPRDVAAHLLEALRQCWRRANLRRLLIESTVQKGTYKTLKDYLQPALQQAALLAPFLVDLEEKGRAAVLVGVVYFALYLLSAFSARQAHRVRDAAGGAEVASRWIWLLTLAAYLALALTLAGGSLALGIGLFVVIAVLQNLWLPIYLERLDEASELETGATVLSVDAQSRSVYVMLSAPLIGWAVDLWGLYPVGLWGALTAALICLFLRRP